MMELSKIGSQRDVCEVNMVDISKYLEYQMKMTKTVQDNRKIKTTEESRESVSSDESDYVPRLTIETRNRGEKIEKSKDDGDVKTYEARIGEWKSKRKDDDSYHELNGGLRVPGRVWNNLYRYQKTGVKWLWELHQCESGGLLGDEMGLGKTVQIIAFLSAMHFSGKGKWNGLGPTLIVAPATVIHQWVGHFHEWWPPLRVAVLHQSGSYAGPPDRLLRDVHGDRGVLIATYAGFVKHHPSLELREWHHVILDEGHKIRNSDTQVSKAVRRLKTPHRIVITGSPLQNNLQELWSLFDFITPGLLGSLPAFLEHFALPITRGGYANATSAQEALALSLAIALKDTISPYMLRRTKEQVREHLNLPDKSEQVLFCCLSDKQKDLYLHYLKSDAVRSILDKESSFGEPFRARILVALTTLRKICNHPDLFAYSSEDDYEYGSPIEGFGFWRRAGKMIVINSLLKIWKKQGHRALIFTQSRLMLNVLEQFLQQCDYKYLKMSGATSVGCRQPIINLFNDDRSYLVFLATTRVGGLGVNLVGADRVIIYDPDWNPATDSQAKERAWRIGQRRNVTIYRLLCAGTIEEKIYQRQIFKQLLSDKVLLNPNQKNYLKTSTLQGLFALEEPDAEGATETTDIFKHTKIDPKKKSTETDTVLLSGGVSFSDKKMAAMRRLAQKISKTLSEPKIETVVEDPRERYKRKMMPPPPEPEKSPVNMVDDVETVADFSTILSEIDIVNMYSKRLHSGVAEDSSEAAVEVNDAAECTNVKLINDSKKEKRKRVSCGADAVSSDEDEKIEFLKSAQKIKESHKKRRKKPKNDKEQDDYVLEKLFAKSGVKSALQHDKIVGLAEREERHRLRTEAQEKAFRALKALKKSRVKNWRW